ncbi:hypothetical protein [Xanthocytophaga flava]|uniref:hypothetical protein n=1 Tax=Xanthocytophaga flava TaxID=3048013 RepID=UPI0028D2A79C|nr:hypothetical protein [Xanthocytophaga flavus]MDJ1471590.1 hypothetical protein [Xanthocytophaga flavus]
MKFNYTLFIYRILPVICIVLALWFMVIEIYAWAYFFFIIGVPVHAIFPKIHLIYWLYAEFAIVISIAILYRHSYAKIWFETVLIGLILTLILDSIYWIVDYWLPEYGMYNEIYRTFHGFQRHYFFIFLVFFVQPNPIICSVIVSLIAGVYYFWKVQPVSKDRWYWTKLVVFNIVLIYVAKYGIYS